MIHLQHEVDACLRLLDDPDTTVTAAVSTHLQDLGPDVIPLLQHAQRTGTNDVVHHAITGVIHDFQRTTLLAIIKLILDHKDADAPDLDLQHALLLLNTFGKPGITTSGIPAYLDTLALRVHDRFIGMHPASDLTQLLAIHSVLYEEERYQGAVEQYYDPQNSYFTSVIARRQGLPVALACIELLLAERTGLDLLGVALPYHFVLYVPELDLYVDAFRGGTFLSKRDCATFVNRSGLTFADSMLTPVRNVDIIVRMLGNLALAHTKVNDIWEAETLQSALDALNFSSPS